MKVLQINSVCGYGSTGGIVVNLYNALTQQGHECCVAYGRGKADRDIDSMRIGTDADVYLHGFVSRVTDKQGFYSKKATKQFAKWLKSYDPDIIHLHNLHGYYLDIEILFDALRQLNKPVIWTLHDCWAFTGHCSYFDCVGCDKWKSGCYSCPQKKEYPTSYLLDHSRSNYERKKAAICSIEQLRIVTPSKWLRDLVAESFLGRYPSEVIHNGIDLNTFQPTYQNIKEKYGLQNKKIILGVASEWGKRKGIQDFLKLSDMLEDDYQIVLIGRISGNMLEKKNITYISRTNDKKELASWYTEADVFFNPTYEDNYPTVNLEAQACGTPVITYYTGGSPEGLRMEKSTVVQNVLDARNIILGMENKGTTLPVSDLEDLSVEHMASQYIELYGKMVDVNGSRIESVRH